MNRIASLITSLGLAFTAPACMQYDIDSDLTSTIDESTSSPVFSSARIVALDIQSAHPYADGLDEVYTVNLEDAIDACAHRVRLHFSAIGTQAGADFLTIEESGQSFDGEHGDVWSEWIELEGAQRLHLRLESDGAIGGYGFAIDAVEWGGVSLCPVLAQPACGQGMVNVAPRSAGICGCAAAPVCVPLDDIEISYGTRQGRGAITGKRISGTTVYDVTTGPADGRVYTPIGSIDRASAEALARAAAEAGLFTSPGYHESATTVEWITVSAGDLSATFVAPSGEHAPEVAALIAQGAATLECGDDASLTCADGFACTHGQCVEAENANAMCGSILGRTCSDGYRCRYDEGVYQAPYPDAAGSCVSESYCDMPEDCSHLFHIAIPGAWACEANTCVWR